MGTSSLSLIGFGSVGGNYCGRLFFSPVLRLSVFEGAALAVCETEPRTSVCSPSWAESTTPFPLQHDRLREHAQRLLRNAFNKSLFAARDLHLGTAVWNWLMQGQFFPLAHFGFAHS